MTGKYLITTDQWFIAPDGRDYKSVWGNVEIIGDEVLGIKTNARSTNWFAKVGSDDNHVIVAGCQVHYAVKCEAEPNTSGGQAVDWNTDKITVHPTPNKIYIAQ